ncbi:plasmid stabilization protein [Modestobacter sp. I12A-02628]|uniref:Type II toxin-antitoxin system RelE/ParE family toxin n=1 Tax=Goekera deserti TaxID=2497753 RepID=A0A7K3WIE2_9ACTN|nr:type II toxin-antitoxin system RelE/ParE family toxin [Goekera deserti]MPQ96576.1 plasmid stabilization protein [Goekera deserti]NDI47112.1 type II toxin-antitoxin system RelE/ParE family toxin [Goekera deserti]NEL55490.1 type II toxin-antitoxin system RelE/ParE family toxin [Goekera deserti]
MRPQVRLSPSAARQLRALDAAGRERVRATVELLAVDPRPPSAQQLRGGAGEWRVRTGGYRVVYELDERGVVVLFLEVGDGGGAAAPGRG